MKRSACILVFCLVSVVLLIPQTNWAADECFLRIEGIRGDAQAKGYQDWINITGWSLGGPSAPPVSSATTRMIAPVKNELKITKYLDIASPALQLARHSGTLFRRARLECRRLVRDASVISVAFEFESVQVTGLQNHHSTGGNIFEAASIGFYKIKMIFTPVSPDGKALGQVISGWDYQLNKTY